MSKELVQYAVNFHCAVFFLLKVSIVTAVALVKEDHATLLKIPLLAIHIWMYVHLKYR